MKHKPFDVEKQTMEEVYSLKKMTPQKVKTCKNTQYRKSGLEIVCFRGDKLDSLSCPLPFAIVPVLSRRKSKEKQMTDSVVNVIEKNILNNSCK